MIHLETKQDKKIHIICGYEALIIHKRTALQYMRFIVRKQVGTRLGDKEGYITIWNIKELKKASNDELNDLYMFINEVV